MRIKTFILSLFLMAFLAIQGCYDSFNCENGQGSIVSEEINIPPFTSITFDEAGSVIIKQDTVQQVIVESYPNLISGLNTTVRDGVWNIRFRECFNRYDQFEVYISVPDLNAIVLNGSGNIRTEGPVESDIFYVGLKGSGNIDLELYCDMIDAELPGSGNITLAGSTDTEVLFLSGSGNIRTFDLESNLSDVTISGSGNCEVFVNEQLDVLISGSGSVRYKGNPPTVNSRITGSGSVSPVN